MNDEMHKYLKAVGSRIRCELNDLKRTTESAAKELEVPLKDLKDIIEGKKDEETTFRFIDRLSDFYPIDGKQLYLLKDDTINGIRYMGSSASYKSRRVFNRKSKSGELKPYYEYRDTAMSRLCLFKPEWILMLREVNDFDPYNPDMVLNKGHNLHQFGLFVGPVNFYWEDINGINHCTKMQTRDSNYITPFLKHSFTTRDANELAYIVACTNGGEVSRAQREAYALGPELLKNFILNFRSKNEASIQLLKQYIFNDIHSLDSIDKLLKSFDKKLDIYKIISTDTAITSYEYEVLSSILKVEVSDLVFPEYREEDDMVLNYNSSTKPHSYPSIENPRYLIHQCAKTSKMPFLKGSIIEVLCTETDISYPIKRSLHTYMINFGKSEINLEYKYKDKIYKKKLYPYDSIYLKPFIQFALGNPSRGKSNLFCVGISGSMNLAAQKELSTLAEPPRVITELQEWY